MNKKELLEKRTEFFEEILSNIRKPPSKIDKILKQDKYFIPIDERNTFYDVSSGDLVINVTGKAFDSTFDFAYTIWQYGNSLKLGLAIYSEFLHVAIPSDNYNEVFSIWGHNNEPYNNYIYDYLYYNWDFNAEKLYDDYKEQEKFILGIRHMHFRVLRLLINECEKIKNNKMDDERIIKIPTNDIDNLLKGNDRIGKK